MSDARREAFIDAPVSVIWNLVSDIDRHPEWWPRVIEIDGERFEQGCTYREVVQTPLGKEEMNIEIEQLDDCENLSIRCVSTGTYVNFLLTEAQGGTFVDSRMGMDPKGVGNKVFDAILGRRFFTGWLQETVEALERAARRRDQA
ncbi:MAG: SRPBCC family protein [Solirubrobacterales bacterium]